MAYDIDALKRKVVAKYPWFGSVAAGVEYIETTDIRTTAGNGKAIFYNPEYLGSLTESEQLFSLAHEICHVAFNHIRRSEGKDKEIWKAATDAVINQFLKKDGLELAGGSVDYPEAIGYDAESYYEILLEQKLAIELVEGNMNRPQGSGGQSGDEDQDGERKLQQSSEEDDHSMWEDALEDEKDEEQENEEQLLKELEKIRELAGEMEDGELPPPDDGEGGGDDEDEEDENALLQKTVSQAGNSERRDIRSVPDIGNAAPIIDWRMLLRDTVNYGVDWSMVHAVIEDGMVRPILEERPMPETEIVLDTSWSVDEDLLRNFLRECKNILQLSKLKAGCFDTVFYGFTDIRTEEDIENMTFEGGGGTDFNAAVEAFSLRVDNRIVFTDGEAPMPEKPLDAIWMVYGGEKIEPAGGRVIHITDEQLERLKRRR